MRNHALALIFKPLAGKFKVVSRTGFIDFSIDPYSKNDLVSAPELELQLDDLVLRDRGYLTKKLT